MLKNWGLLSMVEQRRIKAPVLICFAILITSLPALVMTLNELQSLFSFLDSRVMESF